MASWVILACVAGVSARAMLLRLEEIFLWEKEKRD